MKKKIKTESPALRALRELREKEFEPLNKVVKKSRIRIEWDPYCNTTKDLLITGRPGIKTGIKVGEAPIRGRAQKALKKH